MLPDYKKIKDEMQTKMVEHLFSQSSQKESILEKFPVTLLHEGDGFKKGDPPPEGFTTSTGIVEIKDDEFEALTMRDIESRFSIAFDEIVKEKSTGMMKLLEQSFRKMDLKDGIITSSDVLVMLEQWPMEFNEDGSPILPTIVTAPGVYEKSVEALTAKEMKEFIAKQELIMIKKREAWRASENNRKLVG